jgi:oxygen-dependent protoporphyrinogen oxidase
LAAAAPRAAAAAARIETASSALVGLALPADAELPEHSGILVSTEESLRAKAFTLSSRKWPHLARREVRLLRASFGRHSDATPLSWSDAKLTAAAVADLATVTGRTATPLGAVVQRWPGGLPQYGPAHGDLVAEIRAGLADLDGIAVAGSYLAGVGVPACIAAASAAAAALT